MAASKIDDIIDEIEHLIDESKPAAFSTNKIVVNKDDLESLIQDLRTHTPEEIRKYQRMIAQREQILADAKDKADKIISQAQIQTNELVSEHQIMQQAYAQANEVVLIASKNAQERIDKATEEANSIKMGAIEYTDQLLANIQIILSNSVETTRSRTDDFLATMQTYLNTVEQNRASLVPETVDNEAEKAATSKETNATVHTAVSPQNNTPSNDDEDDDLPALDIPEQFFNKE